MRVTLFDYTGAGSPNPGKFAAAKLLFTKSTRLNMTPELFDTFLTLPDDVITERLKEMAKTNPGSWEFINFSFLVQSANRALTHQLVRTRQASYAQQTMRVLHMDKWTYDTGPSIKDNIDNKVIYDSTMKTIDYAYQSLIKNGAKIEDARGLLPTNIHTNICMTINMRNFISMARKRQSLRVQNDHVNMINLMIIEIQKVYPWFWIFYSMDEMKAYTDLSHIIQDNKKLSQEEKTEIYKLLDIIKGEM